MELKAGSRLRSVVCGTEVIVVKPPEGEVVVSCGGQPMVDIAETTEVAGEPDASLAEGTLLGKRYVDDDLGLELLCTKPGDGSLSIDGQALPTKEAKPLPSSD